MKLSKRRLAAVLSGCLALGQVTPATASPDISTVLLSEHLDDDASEISRGGTTTITSRM